MLPWIALGAIYLLWGSTYLGIRVAVQTMPPYLMTGTRYLVAGLALLALRLLFAKERLAMPSRATLGRIAVTAVLLLVVGNGLLCLAETRVESATAALLVTTTPIWMLVLGAWQSRKMPGWPAVGGIALGTAGMFVLVGKAGSNSELFYVVLILAGSASWALGSVYARDKEHHPLTAPLEMAIGGFGSILVGLALGEARQVHVASIAPASWLGMLWLITGGAMAGYSAYAYALRTLPTETVATYAYVNPIVAVALGALLLKEPITPNVLAGGAAIVASVILIVAGSSKDTPSHPEELPDEAIA